MGPWAYAVVSVAAVWPSAGWPRQSTACRRDAVNVAGRRCCRCLPDGMPAGTAGTRAYICRTCVTDSPRVRARRRMPQVSGPAGGQGQVSGELVRRTACDQTLGRVAKPRNRRCRR